MVSTLFSSATAMGLRNPICNIDFEPPKIVVEYPAPELEEKQFCCVYVTDNDTNAQWCIVWFKQYEFSVTQRAIFGPSVPGILAYDRFGAFCDKLTSQGFTNITESQHL